MSTLLAGASLTVFMGIASTFSGITSASYSMTYWPSMETCIQAVNKEINTTPVSFKVSKLEGARDDEYGKSVKYSNTTVTYLCRPLENK